VNSSEADLHKLIPNNVYIELLSELGLVATAVFLLFMAMLFRRTRGAELAPLRWGLLALLLVWNAFPTYTLISIWAFFALIVGASARISPVPTLMLAETPAPLAGAAG
jgi:O-antigen ligase